MEIDAKNFTSPEQESTDPVYLAWRDAKVLSALKASLDNPDAAIPQAEIWKHFGLEP